MSDDDLNHDVFWSSELWLVAVAPPPDVPALGVGDYCRLNSGGPRMTVVDLQTDLGQVTTAWHTTQGEVVEDIFSTATVRRAV